eukprot:766043-Hanusia_phi.AAC.2
MSGRRVNNIVKRSTRQIKQAVGPDLTHCLTCVHIPDLASAVIIWTMSCEPTAWEHLRPIFSVAEQMTFIVLEYQHQHCPERRASRDRGQAAAPVPLHPTDPLLLTGSGEQQAED